MSGGSDEEHAKAEADFLAHHTKVHQEHAVGNRSRTPSHSDHSGDEEDYPPVDHSAVDVNTHSPPPTESEDESDESGGRTNYRASPNNVVSRDAACEEWHTTSRLTLSPEGGYPGRPDSPSLPTHPEWGRRRVRSGTPPLDSP